ncbi:acyl-CoA dehydrogenase [Limnochorda pilosa]|uniref:Acyl-CoA dehydrogenase n=1 Tax=Limnochorda pilosa TaxID=1555112 RepID=A0A0K2SGB8_LIMPI|nr:acyl-CoA dehydrogenase [Limnochorda pilosa]
MDLKLTDEQRQILEMVRELARERIAPGAGEWDEKDEFPWEVVDAYREAGLYGLAIPEAYGGVGASELTQVLVVEELAKVDAGSAIILAVQWLGALPILVAGSEEQKQRYLPRLATGEWLSAMGLTEPEAGSDVAGLQTRAVREPGGYRLTGQKKFITNGGVADVVTTFARTGGPGPKGISAFIVEKGYEGFSVGRIERKLGIRSSNTAELLFDDCRVPEENRIGEEGEGFSVAMRTLDRSRPSVAAQALGIAEGAFDAALQYAQERKAFGREIAQFQAIQFMLADMAMGIEAARGLVYRAAEMVEEEGRGGRRLVRANRYSSMAKCFASDMAMKVTTDAVQIFGGYGYIKDFPVERYMRDAKITQIYEGTNEIQRIVIARSYLSEGA